ncbi:MAG: histidinol-phosphate transaminase, partial [Actinomycetota bacterium]
LVDQGVLIRDVGVPGYLRITVGTEAENQAFIDALRKAL